MFGLSHSPGTEASFQRLFGEMLADITSQGAITYPIERFRLDRFRDVLGS